MSAGVSVIIEDVKKHPPCPHGPTLLFRTLDNKKPRTFFGCSACRDRKQCSIFVWQDDSQSYLKRYWTSKIEQYLSIPGPRAAYQTFMDVLQTCEAERMYCHDCAEFQLPKYQQKHLNHQHAKGIKEETLRTPSKFLLPLEDAKKEAQYLFNDVTCKFIVDTIMKLGYKYVLCIGAPRIHEYILNNCVLKVDSFLMDFDKRYMAFNNPMQFAWYNMFNHHFFFDGVKENYEDFLSNNKGNELIIVTDPPFGGRIEALASTLEIINKEHQAITKLTQKLPTFFVFPYFMEPQILKLMDNFVMLDYKVDYDNQQEFSDGPKGRKQGSPVRIFTNIDPSLIELPEEDGYKYCKKCKRWVSEENQHCDKCGTCTSKNGARYFHCDTCKKCVKATWVHCETCNKCALAEHSCGNGKNKKSDVLSKKQMKRNKWKLNHQTDKKGAKQQKFEETGEENDENSKEIEEIPREQKQKKHQKERKFQKTIEPEETEENESIPISSKKQKKKNKQKRFSNENNVEEHPSPKKRKFQNVQETTKQNDAEHAEEKASLLKKQKKKNKQNTTVDNTNDTDIPLVSPIKKTKQKRETESKSEENSSPIKKMKLHKDQSKSQNESVSSVTSLAKKPKKKKKQDAVNTNNINATDNLPQTKKIATRTEASHEDPGKKMKKNQQMHENKSPGQKMKSKQNGKGGNFQKTPKNLAKHKQKQK